MKQKTIQVKTLMVQYLQERAAPKNSQKAVVLENTMTKEIKVWRYFIPQTTYIIQRLITTHIVLSDGSQAYDEQVWKLVSELAGRLQVQMEAKQFDEMDSGPLFTSFQDLKFKVITTLFKRGNNVACSTIHEVNSSSTEKNILAKTKIV